MNSLWMQTSKAEMTLCYIFVKSDLFIQIVKDVIDKKQPTLMQQYSIQRTN